MRELRPWLRDLPKAELHVHLEGTVSPQAYERIARRNGATLPSDIGSLFRCSDFDSFLQSFLGVAKTLREPEDFADITQEYLAKSAQHGVRHVEFFFSPATIRHFHRRADLLGIVQAIYAAAERAKASHRVSSLVIFDMVRNLGDDAALADVDLAQQCTAYGVVGVGLGGDERNFPARDFFKPFDRAAKLGLRRTAHAGEAAGAQSVLDAIEILGAERVGHGVAAAQEDNLMGLIAQRRVGIDCCLTSNRVTGVWNQAAEHPLKAFLARGIPATLSSDDPAFFGSTILDEFEQAMALGLTREDVIRLARNSFRMSFASDAQKQGWAKELASFVERSSAWGDLPIAPYS